MEKQLAVNNGIPTTYTWEDERVVHLRYTTGKRKNIPLNQIMGFFNYRNQGATPKKSVVNGVMLFSPPINGRRNKWHFAWGYTYNPN